MVLEKENNDDIHLWEKILLLTLEASACRISLLNSLNQRFVSNHVYSCDICGCSLCVKIKISLFREIRATSASPWHLYSSTSLYIIPYITHCT